MTGVQTCALPIYVKAYKSIAMAVQDLSNGKIKLVCGDKDTLTAAINAVNEGI